MFFTPIDPSGYSIENNNINQQLNLSGMKYAGLMHCRLQRKFMMFDSPLGSRNCGEL